MNGKKVTKISVIIPFYNAEKFIENCLKNILNQTINQYEVIMVDDGSTDNGLASDIIKDYQKDHENLYLIEQPNSGMGGARNAGLNYSNGEYIYFQDVDDFIKINALEIFYDMATKYKAEVVTFNSISVYEDGTEIHGRYEKRDILSGKKYTGLEYILACAKSKELHVPVWLYFYNKKFLEKNLLSFHPYIYHEDNIFSMDVWCAANSIVYINKDLHVHLVHKNSIVNSKKTVRHLNGAFYALKVAEKRYNKYKENPKLKPVFKQWNYINAGLMLNSMKNSDLKKEYKWKFIQYVLKHPETVNIKMFIKIICC